MTDYDRIKKLLNITKSQGFTADELEICKSEYAALPQTLIDFYIEFGKYDEFPDGFRCARLLMPSELASKEYRLRHSRFLVFCIDDWSHLYGVNHEQLKESNPPVYRYNIDRKDCYDGDDGWMLYCRSVQDFLIAFTYEKSYFLHRYQSTLYTIKTDDSESLWQ